MAGLVFDLIVVGGGPGGYVAAIRAAQLGLKVACVEKRATLGGTCLNVGCVPSKALLHSSHLYEMAGHELARHGVAAGPVGLDLAAMMARKEGVVADLAKGIDFLFKKNRIERVRGTARIVSAGSVEITDEAGGRAELAGKALLIATGSEVAPVPGITIDERRIVSSTGALSLPHVPTTLAVIGGGVIGLELGSVWRRLGATVTVVEFLPTLLRGMDGELARQMQRILARQGMAFRLGSKVAGAEAGADGVRLAIEPAAGGPAEILEADVVLAAIGRIPCTRGLGLAEVGVAQDARGFVTVDRHYRTSQPGIFAIGDVIGGAMLAHKAEEEGVAVAEILAGQAGHVNYDAIPGVVYTSPEAASVGRTEEGLKEAGIDYRSGRFSFAANSRARATGETEGFVKILADARTDRILGAHIIGPGAGELIQEIVLAMEFGGSAEDLARTCHAHPGFAEAVREAALAVAGRAIHA